MLGLSSSSTPLSLRSRHSRFSLRLRSMRLAFVARLSQRSIANRLAQLSPRCRIGLVTSLCSLRSPSLAPKPSAAMVVKCAFILNASSLPGKITQLRSSTLLRSRRLLFAKSLVFRAFVLSCIQLQPFAWSLAAYLILRYLLISCSRAYRSCPSFVGP